MLATDYHTGLSLQAGVKFVKRYLYQIYFVHGQHIWDVALFTHGISSKYCHSLIFS